MPKQIDRSSIAVRRQLQAMGGAQFEIGVRDNRTGKTIIRQWTQAEVENSLFWLKSQNVQGYNVYVRLQGSQGLLLLDDVGLGTIEQMKLDGAEPALVVETSPMNFQAWVRVSNEPIPELEATQIAKVLAQRYNADSNSADYRHFGRLAGFTNPKQSHAQSNGTFPFVLLRESKGKIASNATLLRLEAKKLIETQSKAGGGQRPTQKPTMCVVNGRDPTKAYLELAAQLIDSYGQDTDYSRVDWMVVKTLLSEGFSAEQIKVAMQESSPSLQERKKGHVDDYINRTVEKAVKKFSQGDGESKMSKGKAWEQERKARTHQLIQVGGLAEIAGILEIAPGALLGGFLVIADVLKDEATFNAYKQHGDTVLKQRAEARKAKKKAAND